MHFYIASSMFSEEDEKHIATVEEVLRSKGHTFFSPIRQQLGTENRTKAEWRTYTYRNDLANVRIADAILAIVPGNFVDAGTIFEVGTAHMMHKPFFIYNPTGNLQNLMLTESTQAYLEGEAELKAYDFDEMPIKPYDKDAY